MTDDEILAIYASAPVDTTDMEVIELSASWFSQPYYMLRTIEDDIEVVLETNETVVAQYVPLSLGKSSSTADLTYERTIIVGWVNDIIATEKENYDPAVHGDELPSFTSRFYIYYRDGTISSIKGSPVSIPIRKMSSKEEATTFTVSAKPTNSQATGELATPSRIPMLRGFL